MGQYYSIIIKTPDNKIHYNDRTIKDEGYIMAKLMEHSYKETYLMKSVANVLYNGKCRLIWCGDYHGLNNDKVGSWAWDEVSVCNKRSDFPKDYKLVKIQFKEEY